MIEENRRRIKEQAELDAQKAQTPKSNQENVD